MEKNQISGYKTIYPRKKDNHRTHLFKEEYFREDVKNIFKLDISDKYLPYDKNIATNYFEEFYKLYLEIKTKLSKDEYLMFKYSLNIYPYEFIVPQDYLFENTSKIIDTYDRKYKIRKMLDPSRKPIIITTYKPFTQRFFHNYEIINNFLQHTASSISNNEKMNILEITNEPSFLESIYYYELNNKNYVSNYFIDYYTKYNYSKIIKSKPEKLTTLDHYTQFLKKHKRTISENIIDTKLDYNLLKKSESLNPKYDIIFAGLTDFDEANVKLIDLDQYNVKTYFNELIYGLLNLKNNGTIIISLTKVTCKAIADIVLIGKKYFKETHLYCPEIHNQYKLSGVNCIFKYFNKSLLIKSDLDNLLSISKQLDSYNFTSNNIISSFITPNSNSKEYEFIRQFNQTLYLQKFLYLNKLYDFIKNDSRGQQPDSSKNMEIRRREQLVQSILYCVKYNFDYIEPKDGVFKDKIGELIIKDMYSKKEPFIFRFSNDFDSKNIPVPSILTEYLRKIYLINYLIDTRNIDDWFTITNKIAYYKPSEFRNRLTTYIQKKHGLKNISQAWLKMYEMMFNLNLINKKNEDFKIFSICEAPGNFINSIDTYRKRETKVKSLDWTAQTLNPKMDNNKSVIGDDYGYLKNNPDKWDYGIDNTGDILKKENIKYYKKIIEKKNIDLLTGDCGVPNFITDDSNKLFNKLQFGEILFGLYCLPNNKNMVIKLFYPTADNIIIYMLYLCFKSFEEMIIYKSVQNRQSVEYYLVCKNYIHREDQKIFDKLFDILDNFEPTTSLQTTYPKIFIDQLVSVNKQLLNLFIFNRQRDYYYLDNKDLIEKNHYLDIEKAIKRKNKEFADSINL